MKTWLSFLLPDDEYKEQRILQFLGEAAVIQCVYTFLMIFITVYAALPADLVLLGGIALFILYVYGRYILSGIEYTEVSSESAYKKGLKTILVRTATFVTLYTVVGFVMIGVPESRMEWIDAIGLGATLSICMIGFNFISLKRSYKKNKELL